MTRNMKELNKEQLETISGGATAIEYYISETLGISNIAKMLSNENFVEHAILPLLESPGLQQRFADKNP